MSLKEDIEDLLKTHKKSKAVMILEHKEEIDSLIKNKIPFQTQIDLLVKNKIVDKISLSEYKKILVGYFDYVPNSKSSSKTKAEKVLEPKPKLEVAGEIKKEKINPARSAKDILSQEVSLL